MLDVTSVIIGIFLHSLLIPYALLIAGLHGVLVISITRTKKRKTELSRDKYVKRDRRKHNTNDRSKIPANTSSQLKDKHSDKLYH